jgi:hypothetical protein
MFAFSVQSVSPRHQFLTSAFVSPFIFNRFRNVTRYIAAASLTNCTAQGLHEVLCKGRREPMEI